MKERMREYLIWFWYEHFIYYDSILVIVFSIVMAFPITYYTCPPFGKKNRAKLVAKIKSTKTVTYIKKKLKELELPEEKIEIPWNFEDDPDPKKRPKPKEPPPIEKEWVDPYIVEQLALLRQMKADFDKRNFYAAVNKQNEYLMSLLRQKYQVTVKTTYMLSAAGHLLDKIFMVLGYIILICLHLNPEEFVTIHKEMFQLVIRQDITNISNVHFIAISCLGLVYSCAAFYYASRSSFMEEFRQVEPELTEYQKERYKWLEQAISSTVNEFNEQKEKAQLLESELSKKEKKE